MSEHDAPQFYGPRVAALERRIDDHSAKIEKHNDRLHQGDIVIDRLTTAVDRLTTTVEVAINASKPNWGQKVVEALIFWAVPVLGTAALWAIAKSGAVNP